MKKTPRVKGSLEQSIETSIRLLVTDEVHTSDNTDLPCHIG